MTTHNTLIHRYLVAGYDVPEIAAALRIDTAQIMAAIAYERTRRRRLERWTARRLHALSRCSLRLGMWLGDWSERWA